MARLKWFIPLLLAFLFGLYLSRFSKESKTFENSTLEKISPSQTTPLFDAAVDQSLSSSRGKASVSEPDQPLSEGTLIARTSSLSFLVSDVRFALSGLENLTKTSQGEIINSQISEEGQTGRLLASLTLRLPSDKHQNFLDESRKLAQKIVWEETQAEDLTRQVVDLEARLRNAKSSETQLLRLMERSASVSDILGVQRELNQTRETIEILQAQLDNLGKRTSFATITIYLATEEGSLPLSEEKWRPLSTAKNALRAFIKLIKLSLNIVIWLAIFTVPVLILLLIPLLLLRKILSRSSLRRK